MQDNVSRRSPRKARPTGRAVLLSPIDEINDLVHSPRTLARAALVVSIGLCVYRTDFGAVRDGRCRVDCRKHCIFASGGGFSELLFPERELPVAGRPRGQRLLCAELRTRRIGRRRIPCLEYRRASRLCARPVRDCPSDAAAARPRRPLQGQTCRSGICHRAAVDAPSPEHRSGRLSDATH